MKAPRFEYIVPTTVRDAVAALAADEEAKLLAGGQSLVPLMNMRLAQPSLLVDLNRLAALDHVTVDDGEVRIGALCRHRRLELDPAVASATPLLAEAAALVGHPQVRNRGTFGGSLAHADPASELGCALLALGGVVAVEGPAGLRSIAAADLFEGFLTTSLDPREVITEVIVTRAGPGDGSAFVEFSPRHGDFAIASAAVTLHRDASGSCTAARAATAAVGPTVLDVSAAVTDIVGVTTLTDDLLRHVVVRLDELVEPGDDIRATADHRRELARLLLVRALRRAWDRAA